MSDGFNVVVLREGGVKLGLMLFREDNVIMAIERKMSMCGGNRINVPLLRLTSKRAYSLSSGV